MARPLTRIGEAGLVGWRGKALGRVAGPVAERTRVTEQQVRAILGWVALGLVLIYLVRMARRFRSAD